MRVGLLFGGKSFEHDISIITANTLYQILKEKYNLYLLYISHEGKMKYLKKMDIKKFTNKEKLKDYITFCCFIFPIFASPVYFK